MSGRVGNVILHRPYNQNLAVPGSADPSVENQPLFDAIDPYTAAAELLYQAAQVALAGGQVTQPPASAKTQITFSNNNQHGARHFITTSPPTK